MNSPFWMTTLRSAWDTWYECSDLACNYTAQVWYWYYATFLDPNAVACYEAIGCCIGFLMVCIVALVMPARVLAQPHVDAFIAECLDEKVLRADALVDTLDDQPVDTFNVDTFNLEIATSREPFSGRALPELWKIAEQLEIKLPQECP